MKLITLIFPYYMNPQMLERQYAELAAYSDDVKAVLDVIVVDDGSPSSPAFDVPRPRNMPSLRIYRITQDIRWNQHGARNLAAEMANTPWLLMTDVDHVLSAESAENLLALDDLGEDESRNVYRFARIRIGTADSTRAKDKDKTSERAPVRPHINSFLVRKDVYWQSGGYDEDYCGCLCGDSQFLKRLEDFATFVELEEPHLEVYTRNAVIDANTTTLPRDRAEQAECRRRVKEKEASGNTIPLDPLRFGWTLAFS